MRKTLSILMAFLLCLSLFGLTACGNKDEVAVEQPAEETVETAKTEETEVQAEEEAQTSAEEQTAESEPVQIFLSVADAGSIILAMEPLNVQDADGDGAVTINDAMILGHDAYFEGGAEAGYATEDSEYGLTITKFWGVENGGAYGYYVNNVMAYSLTDPIQENDCLYAYSMKDTANYSDCYSYINGEIQYADDGSAAYVGTIYYLAFDENWNPVDTPLANAEVLVNGDSLLGIMTDDAGSFTVPLTESGDYSITAVSADLTLVPPVCHFDFTVG